MKGTQDEWLGLADTARLLGVHPSTVRAWADRGELPAHRTAGGHRRFRRAEVEFWAEARKAAQPSEMMLVVQNAMGRTRFEVTEGRLAQETWYQKLDDAQRQRYRQSGRKLLQDLIRYSTGEDAQAEAQARSLGREYAYVGRQAGMMLSEAIEALLFFREFLMESLFDLYETSGLRPAPAWGDMRRRVSRFTNQMLLALVQAYEQT